MNSKEKKSTLEENKENSHNHYEDFNKLYKELYEERQARKKEGSKSKEPEKEEKFNISLPKQLISSYLELSNPKPLFYVNKLAHYPKEECRDHIVSFREMLFEDILKTRSLIPSEAPKRTLQAAFMTTFGFDTELLINLLKAKVHLTVANDYQKDTEYIPIIENFGDVDGLTVIQPSKSFNGVFYSCFHPKLWLLKFPEFLRVVVSSGNLTTLDWSIWSNCLWYQDFYKKNMTLKENDNKKVKEKSEEFEYDKEFESTLKDYLNNIFPKKIDFKTCTKIDLDEYVFENLDVILIPSFPGRHKDKKYGLAKIRSIIQGLNHKIYKKEEEYVITYQTSSLGTIDQSFLTDICYSFLPNYFIEDENKIPKSLYNDITDNIKVIYPTEKYVVDESYAGPDFAHPLLLNEKNYVKPSFIKKVFHKFEGNIDFNFHHGVLPHLKVGIVTKSDMKIDDDTIIYFGSHNFTASAWGKYEKNRSQLLISNTELGVLLVGKEGSKSKKEEIIKGLTFKFPAKIYEKDDSPWIASSYYNKKKLG